MGGGVRDALLGQPVHDWDLEVFGLEADDLATVLARVGRVDAVGKAFGVLKVRPRGHRGLDIDVSLPRRDSKVGPGHRGILAQGDPHLDPTEAARRRDLTVNAMAVVLPEGHLFDPFGGQRDLQARVLRAVDPTTFLDDPLRALRAARFAAQLGFQATDDLIALAASAELGELPPERIFTELQRLLTEGSRPDLGWAFLRSADLDVRLFPACARPPGLPETFLRCLPERDAIDIPGRRLLFMLAIWLHPSPPPAWLDAFDRLGLHKWGAYPARRKAEALVGTPEAPIASDADLRRLSTRCEAGLWLGVRAAWDPSGPWADALTRCRMLGVAHEAPAPVLLGRHLTGRVPPGPAMGMLLERAYGAQLHGDIVTLDDALAWLDRSLSP